MYEGSVSKEYKTNAEAEEFIKTIPKDRKYKKIIDIHNQYCVHVEKMAHVPTDVEYWSDHAGE